MSICGYTVRKGPSTLFTAKVVESIEHTAGFRLDLAIIVIQSSNRAGFKKKAIQAGWQSTQESDPCGLNDSHYLVCSKSYLIIQCEKWLEARDLVMLSHHEGSK